MSVRQTRLLSRHRGARHGVPWWLPGSKVEIINPVPDPDLLLLLHRAANAVIAALADWADWGPSHQKRGQYASDLAADEAAWKVLDAAGVAVLSEESGLRGDSSDATVVIDPLDGSTNASRRLSWWATSLCAVDADGMAVSLVVDLVHGTRYEATRGAGAFADGKAVSTSGATELSESLIGLSGMPPRPLGWRQFRSLGAASLDLTAVADGRMDGWVDCSVDAHGVWDYLGAALICSEAGAPMVDAHGRDLVVLDHAARRTPVVGATQQLLDQLLAQRRMAMGS